MVDEAFSKDISSRCSLYLMQTAAHWVFAAFDPKKRSFVMLQSVQRSAQTIYDYHRALNELKEAHPLLSYPYHKVFFISSHRGAALVPQALWSDDTEEALYRLSYPLSAGDHLHRNLLQHLESYAIFPAELYLERGLKEHYPEAQIVHTATPFLEGFLVQFREEEEPVMLTEVDAQRMTVSVLKKGKLQLYNTFRYRSREDFLYYLLFVGEQGGMNPNRHRFYFSGFIYRHSELFHLVQKYIREAELVPRLPQFNYSPALKEAPQHLYNLIYSMPLCE